MNRSVGLAARRVRQTLVFANGTRVLTDLATTGTPWHREELVFRTRDGVRIACPNHAGARVPVYEVFVEDCYRLHAPVAGPLAGPLAGLPDAPVVVDIGAQVGCFSIALAVRFPHATVHAYEASPATAAWLERNVRDNGLAHRVTPLAVAVSDHYGTVDLVDDAQAGALTAVAATVGGARTVPVPCVSLAETIRHAGGHADLVKLDAEGAAYDVVLGSSPAVWAGVDRVVMEYHDVPGRGRTELLTFFADAGLREIAHALSGPRRGTVWLARTS